ncbi:MAG: WD40 repeat domain-containing protein [Burkholderiaceae bacterium]|jgi:hypothetical protein|nr:WD40 repeat domain-containing protein [Burkholderiaceae bacterium]
MPKRLFVFPSGAAVGQAYDLRQGLPPLLRPDIVPVTPPGASQNYGCIAVSPNNSYAYFTTSSGTGGLYTDLTTFGSYTAPPLTISGTIYCCVASNDFYANGSSSTYLMVYAYPSNAPQVVSTTGLGSVDGLAFSPDGAYLVVVHQGSPYLRIYSTADWSYVNAAPAGTNPNTYQTGIGFTADGAGVLVFTEASPYLNVFNLQTGARIYSGTNSAYQMSSTSCVEPCSASTPDGNTLLIRTNTAPFISKVDLTSATYAAVAVPAPSPAIAAGGALWVDPDPDEDAVYVSHGAGSTSPPRYITKFSLSTWAVDALGSGALHQSFSNISVLMGTVSTPYQITGTVRDKDNNPCARVVRAYSRATGDLMAQSASDAATGNYTIKVYDAGPYDVQFMAQDGENLNDLFFSQTQPESVTGS